MIVKHLDSQHGNYAPQGDMGLRKEDKGMGKTFYVITAIALLGLAYACTAQAEATDRAMSDCQKNYSFDTCFYQIKK
jgi:hypothetical protein